MDSINIIVYSFSCLLYHHLVLGRNVDFVDRAFVSVWNSPSSVCEWKFGVKLDLSYFDIVVNKHGTFAGDEIVIFYGSGLGRYPSIGGGGKYINGGLPQLANISEHLAKVARDVEHYMPNVGFTGLAVIDWESWRPIFDRDSYNKKMERYILASENLVRKKHPDWSKEKIQNEARREFESAARSFIQRTLETCRKLRPGGYWGLYLFPDCYNYGRGQKHCSSATMRLNDRLSWLYNASTSLYPSIYLSEGGTPMDKYNQVYGSLKEALRVKEKYGGKYLPIVAYSRYRYRDTGKFYSESDLNNSIRQVADAGMNAVALWGSSSSFRSARACADLRKYLDSTLGPFIKNVTISSLNCSKGLCNSHGRCFRTDWNKKSNASATLSFEPASKRLFVKLIEKLLETISGAFLVIVRAFGTMDNSETGRYSGFSCSCFKGWTGQYCQQRNTFI